MRLGSCNSYKSWSAALSYWVWINGNEPRFYEHGLYRRIHGIMLELYLIDRKVRLPMRLNWIVKYVEYLGVYPDRLHTVPIQNLTLALFFITLFFSVSRPAEILFTNSTEDERIEIITTGLRWQDLTFHNLNKPALEQYIEFKVHWYKNQTTRGKPKIIGMQSPLCGHTHCKCASLNYIAMFQVLKQRRRALTDALTNELRHRGSLPKQKAKQLRNLGTEPHHYIFVSEKGAVWSPSHLRKPMKQIQTVIGMRNPEAFPLYCFRIGAMSLINQQKMDLLKALRYVAWAIPKLPHVSARYIGFEDEELRMIPYEMVHGAIDHQGLSRDYSNTKLITFDLADASERIFEYKTQ